MLKKQFGKINLIIIFIIIFSLIITGCQNSTQTQENAKTIVDCIGRKVDIPINATKIAAIDPFSGQTMIMIGAGDKMVSTTNGNKRDKLLEAIYPNLTNVAVIHSSGAINAEALAALKPDFVFLKNEFYIAEGEADKLKKLGIPYLVVKYSTMEEQISTISMIGEAIGGEAKEKADAINEYYRHVITIAREHCKQIPKDKKLRIYHSINEAVRTDGSNSLGADWISAVGGINVSVGEELRASGENYYAGLEQIFVWDPDVIICNEVSTKDYLLTNPKWKGLRAVYEGNVHNIPVGATRWGHQGNIETFFGMLWMGVTLYPDYYRDIDLKDEVISFYKDYLGLEIDDETYNLMLAGEGIRTSGKKSGK
jgi:iron complex transport system substrate-binding protein